MARYAQSFSMRTIALTCYICFAKKACTWVACLGVSADGLPHGFGGVTVRLFWNLIEAVLRPKNTAIWCKGISGNLRAVRFPMSSPSDLGTSRTLAHPPLPQGARHKARTRCTSNPQPGTWPCSSDWPSNKSEEIISKRLLKWPKTVNKLQLTAIKPFTDQFGIEKLVPNDKKVKCKEFFPA